MATAGSKQGGGCCNSSKPPAAGQELDPRYEWEENASSFILRIHLSGFRKQDFRVQVDGAGRLTVRGQRSDAAADARHSRFSKVFQLPSTSDLDDIAGRFDLGVLTLTVPKRLPAPPKEDHKQAKKPEDAAAATKQVAGAKSGRPEPEPHHKAEAKEDHQQAKKPEDEPEQKHKEAAEDKPKAAAAAPAPAADTKKQAATTPKPEPQADAESKAVDPAESLAETVKRRAEEERAKAAAAAERQRKACRGFKERVVEELQGLAGSEWAEGLVETVRRNKEVVAAAVAAFSLGVFVSSRLFSRSSRN